MAEAAPRRYDIKDLTQCGICLLVLEQPKALPCLHSFCLKCLSQWAKGKTSVTCPLCVQEFDIPSDGVNSFRTNFFINTLKEREENAISIQSKETVAPCASCELLERKIEGHCTKCNGFLCADCVGIHDKSRHLKDHKIIPYADLQSGKNIHKKNHCKVHEEQVLRFYCETCEWLICRDCTVVDHPATGHILVNLDSATKGQKTEIKRLTKNCDDVRKKIGGSLEELDVLSEMLVQNATKAEEDIDEAFYNAVKMLENNRNMLKNEVKMVVSEKEKQIYADKDTIQLQQTRLVTALQMATEMIQTGSDYDLALVYSSLKTNLETLRNLKPPRIDKTLGDVSFKPTPTSQHIVCNLGSISSSSSRRRVRKGVEPTSTSQHVTSNIGSISTTRRHVKKGVGVRKMEKSFGDSGNGTLGGGRDIAITQYNDILVTDFSRNLVKCYDTSPVTIPPVRYPNQYSSSPASNKPRIDFNEDRDEVADEFNNSREIPEVGSIKKCPECSTDFPPSFPEEDFAMHIQQHFARLCPMCQILMAGETEEDQQAFQRHVETHNAFDDEGTDLCL